jgi:2-keto-4-pentenoate hydratase/2-oxohepta-3-ene-1,7-dioic acid hydratase in catechol pathway
MKICHYNNGQAGVIAADKVYPLGDALVKAGHARQGYTMLEVITALGTNPAAMDIARNCEKQGGGVPLSSVKLLAPITNPPTIWCAAANYHAHQAEMEAQHNAPNRKSLSKDELMAEFFIKPVSSIIGPNGTVMIPKVSKHVDFECELCAIIGKPARNVSEDKALDYVLGYLILWDFSQRDPWGAINGQQNTRCIRKGFDTFTGLGPWIVTRDEIAEPQDLHINVEQNGKKVMTAHTRDMICGLREHIRFLSGVVTLNPGVLITTGTPAGVSRLAKGDKLKGTIDKIGTMEVSVGAEE